MILNKINFIATFIFLIVILLLPQSLKAQLSMTEDTIEINEVIVTGTPIKVNRNNVPMSVSVINKSQIEDSDESALLPILNGKIPGLFVTERGITGFGVATGSAGQISIRGIGGSPTTGVLMLIDGHPQFMGIMGHPLPDSYVASNTERVEVIRGAASVLYGSNAMGGVINIITQKQTKEGFNGNAKISYGSYNTQKYMGYLGFKKDKISALVSVNHDQTDGHRKHSDFKIDNGYAKLSYHINKHFYASTDVSIASFNAADPGPDTLNASFGETIDILRGYWAFTLQNEFEKSSGSLKLFYNFGEHDITDGFHSTDKNYGFNFYESLQFFAGNSITIGVDYMIYGGMAENIVAMNGTGIIFADTTVNELGVYSFIQQSIKEKLILNGGIRYQNHSVYGSEWIPSLGFAYNFNKSFTMKGNISKGFRSPTLRELFMWGPQNANLQPESVLSSEIGFSNTFAKNKISAELTLYAISGDNLIVTAPINGSMKYLNSGKISNKGIELSLNARASNNLTFNTTYTYVNMENQVYATPEHQFYLNANYKFQKFQLNGSIHQIFNLDNDPLPLVNKESYTLLKAKVAYNLIKGIKFFVSGDNLLNQNYQVNRYYTMPNIALFGGVNYLF